MPTETVDTLIIGGGLSGMYAAYLLSKRNKSFVVLEGALTAAERAVMNQ